MPLPSSSTLPSSSLLPSLDPEDATLYDYESPNGGATIYRARAYTFVGSFEVITGSAWRYAEAPVAWESDSYWLKHPTRPSLNMEVGLASPATDGITRAGREGRHQPLGSTEAVVISDTREAETGTIRFRCDTDEEREALWALADERVPLLFQLRSGEHDSDRWLVLGTHTSERIVDQAWGEARWESFEWTAVERPEGTLAE